MATPFPDRSETLFGRAGDLATLLERTHRPGVTFLFGDSQIGKSTLLKEVARRRSLPVPPSLLGPARCLPGYAESQGQNEDLFLLAVADLYTRWITDATYAEQARVITQQQQKDFIGRFGEALGTTFEKLSKLGGKPAEVVGSTANTLLRSLAATNRDLLSGGLQMAPLSIDQARALLAMVHSITNQPIVLILDQWQKARFPVDANLLESFVRHLEDWPPCHILVAAIPQDAPKAAAEDLHDGFPAEVEINSLAPMDLKSSTEAAALLASVRDRVPAAAKLEDQAILDLIAGHPEVINRWTKRESIQTVARMKELADAAHTHRFSELKILPKLPSTQRLLAMRLALIPSSSEPEAWLALKPILMEGIEAADLDALYEGGVLERSESTIFGHTKRADVALQTFLRTPPNRHTDVANSLCIALGSQLRDTSQQVIHHAKALVRLYSLDTVLGLSPISRLLCQAAMSMFETEWIDWENYSTCRAQAAEVAGIAALLSTGLLNTLNHEKSQQRRGEILDELRALGRAYPADESVRSSLAKALYNVVDLAKGLYNPYTFKNHPNRFPRRGNPLEELRVLAHAFPHDQETRAWFANALSVSLEAQQANREDNHVDKSAVLDELRELTKAFPADAHVRERFAAGLVYMRIVDELRTLVRAFPADDPVRELFAMGLSHALGDDSAEKDWPLRHRLIDELRTLARDYPASKSIRKYLAIHLSEMLSDLGNESSITLTGSLLDEIRSRVRPFTADDPPGVSSPRRFLRGMEPARNERPIDSYKGIHEDRQENVPLLRESILGELRALARAFPKDESVRLQLANSLSNMLDEAREREDLAQSDKLLPELRALAQASTEDYRVRECLIWHLARRLHDSQGKSGADSQPDHKAELRALLSQHPKDPCWPQVKGFLEGSWPGIEGYLRTSSSLSIPCLE